MGKGAFVTGKAMICSLGESPGEIVEAVRHKRIKLEHLPFTLAGLPYTRPYYLITRNEADRLDNRTNAYFFELLFSTVARALVDLEHLRRLRHAEQERDREDCPPHGHAEE